MDIQTILLNLKIDQLNAMQEASIDAWKEGSDLILLSPTGSGKTLAYLLPLVSSLKREWKACRLWYWYLRASWLCRLSRCSRPWRPAFR